MAAFVIAEQLEVTDPKKLEVIRSVLEKSGPIIVEHWFYCGSRAPDRMIFDGGNEFVIG